MKYYNAYEKRYRKMHEIGELWEVREKTNEVIDVINKYNISLTSKILELGCGEGRDAIYLLDKGYNVLAIDSSKSAIKKCNELSNNKYENFFKEFDIIKDTMMDKFNFIYSVALIHMFVIESDRKKFYDFIYGHLKDDGIALIIAMGDGICEYQSDINDAFNDVERININMGKKVMVANTSCKVRNMRNMTIEINNSNLDIIESKIVYDLPNFKECEYFLVKRANSIKLLNKEHLRKYYLSIRNNIQDKNMKDITIYNKVINNFMVQKSNLILIYVSTRGEIDTNLLIKYFLDNNKKVAIPKVNGNDMDFYYISDISEMSIGYKGIYEPITNKKVTNFTSCVSITPGICFSKNNYRIGYGKGFYDKFYKKHNVYKIGLCYKECLVDSFNIDKFDIKVDEIITN